MSNGRGVVGLVALALVVAILVVVPTALAAAPGNGRVWEQVTPAEKAGGGQAVGGGFNVQADGNSLAYASLGAISPDDAASGFNMYIGKRTASGWESTPISPTNGGLLILSAPVPIDISDDLSKALWLSTTPIDEAQQGPGSPSNPVVGAYMGSPGPPFTFLHQYPTSDFGFNWATPDLSKLAFTGTDGTVNHAMLLTGNVISDVGIDPTTGQRFDCGSQIGEEHVGGAGGESRRNAMTDDGSRIFFTATRCGEPQRVYVRENGTTTRELSVSECNRVDPEPVCNAPSEVAFLGASKDGSTVLLGSGQQLTNDDTNDSWDIYTVNVTSGDITRISVNATDPTVNTRAPEEGWTSGVSDDLQTVYFGAQGVLTDQPGPDGNLPVDGQWNLYVWHAGDGISFIETVANFDFQARSGASSGSYVTGNGNFFAFRTEKNLVAEDTDTGNNPYDVYLYDRVAKTLTFASPGGDQNSRGVELPTPTPDSDQRRSPANTVSEDGSHVFLFTADPMVPEDKNLEFDIYEFANGQVSLVSGGKAETNNSPTFIGATATGSDVFFADLGQLVDTDIDGLPDVYDARIDGGFPPPPVGPVGPPAGCREDACQGPPGARPTRPTPGSLTAEPETEPGPVTFKLSKVGASARKRFARTGRLTLKVRVSEEGDVKASASAKIGKRTVTFSRDTASADGAGTVSLTLKLSKKARRALKKNGKLRVSVRVSYSEAAGGRSQTLVLRAPHGKAGRRG
ncbi:MAG TPA: hypothetical protein VGF25_14490 [Thermoleophilaceae bacterium]